MPSLLLIDYLERAKAVYQLVQHRSAPTAEDAARILGIPLRRFAKTVMVRVDGALSMVVVPAHCFVELDRLRTVLGKGRVELAALNHFQHRFPRCEPGAMPPFGHLFGLEAFASGLVDDFDLAFKAGAHDETVVMPFTEFQRLAHVDAVPGCARPIVRTPRRQSLAKRTSAAMGLPLRPLPARHIAAPAATSRRPSIELG